MTPKHDLTDLPAPRFAALFIACFVVAALPILLVRTLPLLDYPNHLARMHIIAAYDGSAALRRFYDVTWRPLPNLAMDAIIPVLARIMPLEWAGKAFFLLTFLLIAGGTAALHRVLFGRWSAWSLLAFLLLYNRTLFWGFGNFLFGLGLALVATACWIGLRDRSPALRLGLATILALAIFFSHLFAFGAYGLLAMAYEAAEQRRQGRLARAGGWFAMVRAGVQFVPPLVIFAAAPHQGGMGGIEFSRFFRKFDLVFSIVDDYVRWFDVLTLVLLVALFAIGGARRRIRLGPAMGLPLLVLLAAHLAMPNRILGAAGVDHRMMLVLALVLVGASDGRLADRRRQGAIAAVLAALFAVRIAIVADFWIAQDRAVAPMVAAFAELPHGSRVAVAYPPAIVNSPRRDPPLLHLAGLAVIAADAFVPTLFADPGQQPLTLRPPYAALAAAATPGMFWDVLAEGRPDDNHRVADALGRYDFILFVGKGASALHATPHLMPRAAIADGRLFALRGTPGTAD